MTLAQFLFGNRKERAQEPKPRAHEDRPMNVQTILNRPRTVNPIVSEEAEAEAWLASKIEQAKICEIAEIIDLSPARAKALLARNPDNRKFNHRKIAAGASDIESRRFLMNGETIIVAIDGSLNDGQNRCAAVIMANRSIRTAIVFGVTRESRMTVDSGEVRTLAQYLGMDGYVQSHVLAAATNLAWHFKAYNSLIERTSNTGPNITKRRPTKAELREFLTANPSLQDAASHAGCKDPGSRTVVAFCRWAIAGVCKDYNAVEEFFSSLRFGAGLARNNPILLCRNRLLNAPKRGGLTNHERADLIFQAWNLYRRNRTGRIGTGSPVLPRLER